MSIEKYIEKWEKKSANLETERKEYNSPLVRGMIVSELQHIFDFLSDLRALQAEQEKPWRYRPGKSRYRAGNVFLMRPGAGYVFGQTEGSDAIFMGYEDEQVIEVRRDGKSVQIPLDTLFKYVEEQK